MGFAHINLTRKINSMTKKTLTKNGEKGRKRRDRLKEAGLCIVCGKCTPIKNLLYCETCKEKRKQNHKIAYQNRMPNPNQCIYCDNPPTENMKTCKPCRDRHKSFALDVKNKVFNAYGGFICKCCGETEKSFLSIDHINNDGNLERRKKLYSGGCGFYYYLKKNNYPTGYQVLCMNCQWGKALNNGVCPHQLSD
jgi:hypothetical protein